MTWFDSSIANIWISRPCRPGQIVVRILFRNHRFDPPIRGLPAFTVKINRIMKHFGRPCDSHVRLPSSSSASSASKWLYIGPRRNRIQSIEDILNGRSQCQQKMALVASPRHRKCCLNNNFVSYRILQYRIVLPWYGQDGAFHDGKVSLKRKDGRTVDDAFVSDLASAGHMPYDLYHHP